jgi:hypothetical protein
MDKITKLDIKSFKQQMKYVLELAENIPNENEIKVSELKDYFSSVKLLQTYIKAMKEMYDECIENKEI